MPIPGHLLTTAMAVMPHRDVDQAVETALSMNIPFGPSCPDSIITKTCMPRPRSLLTSWWNFAKHNQDFSINVQALQTVHVSIYGPFRK